MMPGNFSKLVPMATTYDSKSMSVDILRSKTISIIGYGNQGRAQALNLRDQGLSVTVGARAGSGFDQAIADGFQPTSISGAATSGEIVVMALSDMPMAEIYESEISPNLRAGSYLIFAHGFNILYNLVRPAANINVALVSPKGSGHSLRKSFSERVPLPSLIAVHQDPSGDALSHALAYSAGIGCGSLAVQTTFREETETDLFGEQVVLCGGIPELIENAFNTLVEAGYQPEAAYFECVYEAKLIVDLLLSRGLDGMRKAISDTAEWGGYTVGPQVINGESRAAMRTALNAIRAGHFAKTWIAESKSGAQMASFRSQSAQNAIDPVWKRLNEA